MKLDGISAAALIALAAFAVDRIVSALLFVLLYLHLLPDPKVKTAADQVSAERTYKLVYFIACLILVVIFLLAYPSIRILAAMGMHVDAPLLDAFLTGVVLLGGTERLGEWLKTNGTTGGTHPTEQSIHVTGRLTLDNSRQ